VTNVKNLPFGRRIEEHSLIHILRLIPLLSMQLCGCVSFFVVAGNSSQNENTFLQKNLIGLLYYDLLADVCISYDLTLFYSVSFYFVYFSCTYHADPQVEVQIRILLMDK
jgi:hypothetical protein